jgi:stage III sporulation protein SpoIIIAA
MSSEFECLIESPDSEINAFLRIFPSLTNYLTPRLSQLSEVHFDLGRRPRIILLDGESEYLPDLVTADQFQIAIKSIGPDSFDGNNRAGIDQTLHRFSVLRNRRSVPIGLSARFGRALPGLAPGLMDLVTKEKSILLIGAPGVGKTSTLRGLISMFAQDSRHRVLVVDTNNEVAGDGDVPHPFLGNARRIQVPNPSLQHFTMIEAVSNHAPTVIAIDEVKTELEARAAREIAQRGVIVLATVHGGSLMSVQQNPDLNDLLGGMKSTTVGDAIARKNPDGFRKNIMQREHEVPFGLAVVLKDRQNVDIHWNLVPDIDKGWLSQTQNPEPRKIVLDRYGTLVDISV